MEELQKLETLQRMLTFMETQGLSTNHPDSDRFLAHFLLVLVQPFEFLNMQKRYDLISDHMEKISPAILEDVHLLLNSDRQKPDVDVTSTFNVDHSKLSFQLSEVNKYDNIAKIGLDCMQRANSTLEDFCRSYFIFHDLDVNDPQTLFRFLPVLSFTEGFIYQLDTVNERSLRSSSMVTISPENDGNHLNHLYNKVTDVCGVLSIHDIPRPESCDPLIHLLHSQGLLTERVRAELQSGVEYWELERKLCHALAGKSEILIEDVMRAINLKSFDYRVLNLLLYQLRNEQVNDLHMDFLSISEFLVEVSDDLYDYEDDVMENTFNILRMFARVYGTSKAPIMLAQCITEAEEKYEQLSKALDPVLFLKYQQRCEEATKEGGGTSGHGHAFGKWSIPPVIADEDSFRMRTTSEHPSSATY